MSLIKYIGAALVGAAAVLIGTSPSGVTPPTVPPGSTTVFLPPWPIFRVAISLNEFFEAAAWATRPPPVQVKSLATAYWQSEIAYSLTKNGSTPYEIEPLPHTLYDLSTSVIADGQWFDPVSH